MAKKTRLFLYEDEIEKLVYVASQTRYPIRDMALVLITYNHACRAGEVCKLQWSDIDFNRNKIKINRQKGGVTFTHDLYETEKKLLLILKSTQKIPSPYVFITERNNTFCPNALYYMLQRIEAKAKLEVHFSTHSLRHAKGVFLRMKGISLEDIRDFLGQKNVSSTEIYTRMIDNPFTGLNDNSRLTKIDHLLQMATG